MKIFIYTTLGEPIYEKQLRVLISGIEGPEAVSQYMYLFRSQGWKHLMSDMDGKDESDRDEMREV